MGGVGVAREGRRRVLLGAGMPVLVDRAQGAAAGQVSARVQAVCGRCMTCSMFVCILAIVCFGCCSSTFICSSSFSSCSFCNSEFFSSFGGYHSSPLQREDVCNVAEQNYKKTKYTCITCACRCVQLGYPPL